MCAELFNYLIDICSSQHVNKQSNTHSIFDTTTHIELPYIIKYDVYFALFSTKITQSSGIKTNYFRISQVDDVKSFDDVK